MKNDKNSFARRKKIKVSDEKGALTRVKCQFLYLQCFKQSRWMHITIKTQVFKSVCESPTPPLVLYPNGEDGGRGVLLVNRALKLRGTQNSKVFERRKSIKFNAISDNKRANSAYTTQRNCVSNKITKITPTKNFTRGPKKCHFFFFHDKKNITRRCICF